LSEQVIAEGIIFVLKYT